MEFSLDKLRLIATSCLRLTLDSKDTPLVLVLPSELLNQRVATLVTALDGPQIQPCSSSSTKIEFKRTLSPATRHLFVTISHEVHDVIQDMSIEDCYLALKQALVETPPRSSTSERLFLNSGPNHLAVPLARELRNRRIAVYIEALDKVSTTSLLYNETHPAHIMRRQPYRIRLELKADLYAELSKRAEIESESVSNLCSYLFEVALLGINHRPTLRQIRSTSDGILRIGLPYELTSRRVKVVVQRLEPRLMPSILGLGQAQFSSAIHYGDERKDVVDMSDLLHLSSLSLRQFSLYISTGEGPLEIIVPPSCSDQLLAVSVQAEIGLVGSKKPTNDPYHLGLSKSAPIISIPLSLRLYHRLKHVADRYSCTISCLCEYILRVGSVAIGSSRSLVYQRIFDANSLLPMLRLPPRIRGRRVAVSMAVLNELTSSLESEPLLNDRFSGYQQQDYTILVSPRPHTYDILFNISSEWGNPINDLSSFLIETACLGGKPVTSYQVSKRFCRDSLSIELPVDIGNHRVALSVEALQSLMPPPTLFTDLEVVMAIVDSTRGSWEDMTAERIDLIIGETRYGGCGQIEDVGEI
jgi:hypothetical protein